MLVVKTAPTRQDTEGVWATYSEGVRFKIARAGNPNFLRISDRLEAPHRKAIQRGKLSTEKQLDIQCRAMAEGILLDWEGIATEEGDLEYNVDNATAVLRHNMDVRDFVLEFATEQENFRATAVSETTKKS